MKVTLVDVIFCHALISFLEITIGGVTGRKNDPTPPKNVRQHILAPEGEFTYVVLLFSKIEMGQIMCTGSLIRFNWVMTAAHCIVDEFHEGRNLPPENVTLAAGKSDSRKIIRAMYNLSENNDIDPDVQMREAKYLHVHPRYPRDGGNVALVEVKVAFQYPLELLTISKVRNMDLSDCVVAGWGTPYLDGYLRYTEGLSVVSSDSGKCPDSFTERQFCASSNVEVCSGDAGAPLVCMGLVWGVTSSHEFFAPARHDQNSNPEYVLGLNECVSSVFFTELFYVREWMTDLTGLPLVDKSKGNLQRDKGNNLKILTLILVIVGMPSLSFSAVLDDCK